MKVIKKISIVIPIYNEEKTVRKIVERVLSVDLGKIKKEIILINDGSSDSSRVVLNKLKKEYGVLVISHKKNKGKSCALRTGFKKMTGDVVVIQDGDLEYNPNDFKKMIDKMLKFDDVRVVYGSRRLNKENVQYSGLSFYMGGLLLTVMANVVYGTRITDEPTCYKMFDTKLLRKIKLKSKRFEFCPEVTAKVAKSGIKIYEVPISYNPRHVNQGKKIRLKDFFEAFWVLLKYKFID
ncbi:MAG: glycosyltransferase family 2 protein [Candidatus Shapirobacteria bacterium]|nr:glycosyltransferase family 2 protein [Candidatus Shapirobacteria bacterium]